MPTPFLRDYPPAFAQDAGINTQPKTVGTVDMNEILIASRKDGDPAGRLTSDGLREILGGPGVVMNRGGVMSQIRDRSEDEAGDSPAAPVRDTISHPHAGCANDGLFREIPGQPGQYRCTGCGARARIKGR